jgi:GT2 family glycosyltransferase
MPATDRPATLARCVAALRGCAQPPEQIVVVDEGGARGPAQARNTGAEQALGDVLVFVDADVEVHSDALSRIRDAFAADPGLTGVFGAYDDRPAAPDLVSAFRNLLHHHVHLSSPGAATTFWAGLGAVRRDAFMAVGGFDAERFATASIEDIELGMRLVAHGGRLRLDPQIQGRHLKSWTVLSMVRTDFERRAVPWLRLLLRERTSASALNLGWRHRLSAVASLVVVAAGLDRRPRVAAGAWLAFVGLNASFYRLLARRRGKLQALLAVQLHIAHHLTAIVAVPVALVLHLGELHGARSQPDAR